jgi:hypothetical protein
LVKIGELNLKREWQQIAKILLGNVSSPHLAKESNSHLESRLKATRFRNKCVILLSVYILIILCICGCIQNNKYIEDQSRQDRPLDEQRYSSHIVLKDGANPDFYSSQEHKGVQSDSVVSSNGIDLDQNLRLELDFQSGVGTQLFRSWGTLILWSDSSLPYLMLNATLYYKDRRVNNAKYVLIQVEPEKRYSFDISKNLKMPKGEYNCILEASGPFGLIASEKRDCSALDESAASDLIDEIEASPHKASNDFLSQYTTEVIEEKSPSLDKYANGDQENERILETPPTGLEPESYSDAEISYKSKSAENPETSGQEGQDSIPQGVPSSPSSEGSVRGIYGANRDNRTTAANGGTQIADWNDDGIFVGSTGSNKYHRPDCRFVAKIKKKIYYKSAQDAKKEGKVPCKICNPP